MTRRLVALLLAVGCGGDGSGGHAQALIVHVRFMAPLDATPVDGFELVLARPGGFPDFDPVTTAGDGGDYTLTSVNRVDDDAHEAVLTWPDRWVYDGAFDALFEFDAPLGFPVDLTATGTDGDVPFARGAATVDLPDTGTAEVDLYVECVLIDESMVRCMTPKSNGEACTAPAECQSRLCVDDVCCESACDGICEQCGAGGACEALAGLQAECDAGSVECAGECESRACVFPAGEPCADCQTCSDTGTCDPVPDNTDPRGECSICQMCVGGDCTDLMDEDPKGACDDEPSCPGVCNGSGGCNYANVVGDDCGAAMCESNAIAIPECDAFGECVADLMPEDCGPYACVTPTCPDDVVGCGSNADCLAGAALCDQRVSLCRVAIPVVCGAAGGDELQTAIDACSASPCHLLISGTCDAINVNDSLADKDVYIDGLSTATILGSAGAPVTVSESVGGEVYVTLVGLTVTGVFGGAVGVNASSLDSDPVDIWMEGATVQGNDGVGISANNGFVTLRGTTIEGNTGAGLSLVNSSFDIANTFIVGNGGIGVSVFANMGSPTKTFRHNTVADNAGGGMECLGGAGATSVDRSLFWNGGGTNETTSPGCDPGILNISDIPDPDLSDTQDACGNDGATPIFVGGYHLMAGSTCIDKIPCDDEVLNDFDDDLRPFPGTLCEPGADEVVP